MPYLVIYNEQAGISFANQLQSIEAYFRSHQLSVHIHSIASDGSFSNLSPDDYQRIICVGGDGTVKEVANWIIKANSKTPLAIIPKGTANIVAHALDIPSDIENSIDLAINGSSQAIDVGLVNDREYFLLAAGVGMDAMVIRNTSRPLKKIFGMLAYALSIIQSFLKLRSNKIFIKCEEFEGSVQAQSVVVTKVDTFLKIKLHPEARLNNGLVVVSIFKPLSIFDIITILRKVLRGDYSKDWRFQSFQTKQIYILPFRKRTPIQIDGEFTLLPYLDIRVVPQALNIVTNKTL